MPTAQRVPTMLTRAPRPELRSLVQMLWASVSTKDSARAPVTRERVLPTGAMHLVYRFSTPLRLYDTLGSDADALGYAIVGGARTAAYIRAISGGEASVGAMLRPGAAHALFGTPSTTLAHRHTRLDDLWGLEASLIHERLASATDAEACLACFEAALLERAQRRHGAPAVVAHAIRRFAEGASVQRVVEETGYSHRRFLTLFADAVGLSAKVYCRVQRYQKVVRALADEPERDLALVAYEAGYADQSHMTREFQAHAGLTPGVYRRLSCAHPHHVPLSHPDGA